MDGRDALEDQKRRRLMDNFADDIAPLRRHLDDPEVTDISVGGSGEVVVKKFGKGKTFTGELLPPSRTRGIILSLAALLDKPLDPLNGAPKLEAVIPKPFSARLTGLLPPWVDSPELAIRKPPREIFPLEDYVEKRRMREDEYDLICQYIKDRKNILVGGGTGSGKSTFTNAVLKKMVEYTPDDRFYIVEDVPELQCEARDKTQIEVNPRHAAEAVRTALRWTPDRIIFGEVRYGEVANELIKAWNTGHTGNITTIHADSCSSMLLRVEDLLREEIKGTIPRLSSAIHLCVHLTGTRNGPLIDEVMPTKEGETDDFIAELRSNGLA
jgi:type IV secretion system protein VirB11